LEIIARNATLHGVIAHASWGGGPVKTTEIIFVPHNTVAYSQLLDQAARLNALLGRLQRLHPRKTME